MADVYKGLTIQFRGDTSGLSKALSTIRSESKGVANELKQIQKAMKFNPSSTALATRQIELMKKGIKSASDQLKVFRTAEKDIGKEGMSSEAWTKLQADIAMAESRLQNFKKQLADVYIKQDAANSVLGKAGQTLQNFGQKYEGLGRGMQTVGGALTRTVTPAIIAAGAASIAAAVNIDTSLTNVRKTVDGTEEQYQQLKQAAIDFSKVNAVKADEVLNIQSLGAQLGFAIDELDEFSRVVSGLDIATNMDAEQAATELAQFANITKMAHSDASRYGSTIVALGNNMATTESDISSMAMRLAAAGTQVGMTQADILGLAAALSSMGVQAEAGGTAISTIMSNIDTAVATGSDSMQTWASTAKMSAEEFAAAWKSNPVEALSAVLSGMEQAVNEGGNMSLMLDELGISSLRQTDVMKRLAGNSELVANAVKLANGAWQENNALQKEVDNRNNSLAAKFQLLQNRLTAIAEKVGGPLADALLDIVDAAEPLFDAIERGAQAFADMSKEEQQAALAAVGVAAALGPMLSLIGGGISNITSIGKGISSLAQWFSKIGGAGKAAQAEIEAVTTATTQLGAAGETASKGIKLTSAAIGAMKVTGIALAVALVADLIGKFAEYQKQIETARGATEGLSDAISSIDASYAAEEIDSVSQSTDGLLKSSEDVLKSQAELAKGISSTWKEIGTDSATLDYYVGKIDELTQKSQLSAREQAELAAAVAGYNQITGGNVEVIDAASGKLSEQVGALDRNAEAWQRNAEAQAAAAELVDLKKAQFSMEGELEGINEELANSSEGWGVWIGDFAVVADEASVKYHDLTKRQNELVEGMKSNAKAQERLTQKYEQSQQAIQELNRPIEEITQSLNQATDWWPQLADQVGISSDEMARSLVDLGLEQQDLANLTPQQWETIANGAKQGGDAFLEACASVGLGVKTAAEKAQQAAQEMTAAFSGLGGEGGANFQAFADSFGMNVDQMTAKMSELGINAQQMAEMTPQTFQSMANGLGLSLADMATRLQEAGVTIPQAVQTMVDQASTNLQNLQTAFDTAFGEGSLQTFATNIGMSMDQVVAMLSEKGVQVGTVTQQMVTDMATALNQSPQVVLSALTSLGVQIPPAVQQAFAGAGPAAAAGGEQAMSEGAQGMEQGVSSTDLSGPVSNVVNEALNSARGHESEFNSIGVSLGNSLSTGFASADMASMASAMQAAVAAVSGYNDQFNAAGAEGAQSYASGFSSADAGAATQLPESMLSAIQGFDGQFTSSGSNQGNQYVQGLMSVDSTGAGSQLASNADSGARSIDGSGAGANFGAGFVAGISSYVGAAAAAAASLVRAAKAAADAEAASASPSKEMIKRGHWFGQGFVGGIKDTYGQSKASGAKLVSMAMGSIRSEIDANVIKRDGAHVTSNFAAGIESDMREVEQASEAIAQVVADYIGHSKPAKGPLSDGEWVFGVHTATNYAEGLAQGKPKVEMATDDIADTVETSLQSTVSTAKDSGDEAMDAYIDAMIAGYKQRNMDIKEVSTAMGDLMWGVVKPLVELQDYKVPGTGDVYDAMAAIEDAGYTFDQYKDAVEGANTSDEKLLELTKQITVSLDDLAKWQGLYNLKREIIDGSAEARAASANLENLFSRAGVAYSQGFVERITDGSDEMKTVLSNLTEMSDEAIQELVDSYDDLGRAEREQELNTRTLWVNSLKVLQSQGQNAKDWLLDYRETCLDVKEAMYSQNGLDHAFQVAGISVEEFAYELQGLDLTMEDFTDGMGDFIADVSNGFDQMTKYGQTTFAEWNRNLRLNMAESQAYAENVKAVFAKIPDYIDSEAFRKAVYEGGFSEWGQVMADMAGKSADQIIDAVNLYNEAVNEAQQSAMEQLVAISPGEIIAKSVIDGIQAMSGGVSESSEAMSQEAVDAIAATVSQWEDTGEQLADGVSVGIRSRAAQVATAAADMVKQAIAAANAAADVHSPSKETRYIGEMMGKGLGVGMGDEAGYIARQSQRMAQIPLYELKASQTANNYNSYDNSSVNVVWNVTVRNDADMRELLRNQNKVQNRYARARGVIM